jgi:hypothetical protein
MPQRVQFADDIEPLVQFIEETPQHAIVDQTLAKLRAGMPICTMLTASAKEKPRGVLSVGIAGGSSSGVYPTSRQSGCRPAGGDYLGPG